MSVEENLILVQVEWYHSWHLGYITACLGATFETLLYIDNRGERNEEIAVPTAFNRFGCSKEHYWKPTWAHQLQKWFNVLQLVPLPKPPPFLFLYFWPPPFPTISSLISLNQEAISNQFIIHFYSDYSMLQEQSTPRSRRTISLQS